MSRTTVSQRAAQFLRDHRHYGAYCDKCIAKELRLGAGKNRTMARNVTSVLAEMDERRRASGRPREGRDRLAERRGLKDNRGAQQQPSAGPQWGRSLSRCVRYCGGYRKGARPFPWSGLGV